MMAKTKELCKDTRDGIVHLCKTWMSQSPTVKQLDGKRSTFGAIIRKWNKSKIPDNPSTQDFTRWGTNDHENGDKTAQNDTGGAGQRPEESWNHRNRGYFFTVLVAHYVSMD